MECMSLFNLLCPLLPGNIFLFSYLGCMPNLDTTNRYTLRWRLDKEENRGGFRCCDHHRLRIKRQADSSSPSSKVRTREAAVLVHSLAHLPRLLYMVICGRGTCGSTRGHLRGRPITTLPFTRPLHRPLRADPQRHPQIGTIPSANSERIGKIQFSEDTGDSSPVPFRHPIDGEIPFVLPQLEPLRFDRLRKIEEEYSERARDGSKLVRRG